MAICPTCGRTEPGKTRSLEDHKRYFAIFKALWNHLPEEWASEFSSQEDARKFFQIKAGYFDRISIKLDGADPASAVVLAEAAMRAAGAYAKARVMDGADGKELVVFRPQSIRFSSMDQRAFSDLRTKVEIAIETETGLKIEDLLKAADAP